MRLTKKIFTDLYASPCDEDTEEKQAEQQWKVCNKLGQLEDIEDELGIDLITLFRALKPRFAYMCVQNNYNENYKKGLIKPLIVSNFFKYGEDYKLVLCDSLTCLSYYVSVKD